MPVHFPCSKSASSTIRTYRAYGTPRSKAILQFIPQAFGQDAVSVLCGAGCGNFCALPLFLCYLVAKTHFILSIGILILVPLPGWLNWLALSWKDEPARPHCGVVWMPESVRVGAQCAPTVRLQCWLQGSQSLPTEQIVLAAHAAGQLEDVLLQGGVALAVCVDEPRVLHEGIEHEA